MNSYANQYKQNHIATASPEQLMLMLYDGAIRFVRRAIAGIENNDNIEKLTGISKCMAIIVEFSNTLDHNIGGEIADNLDGLYHFMIKELNAARATSEKKHLEVVEKLLTDLRQTWAEAIEINRQEQASSHHSKADENNAGRTSLIAAG